MLSLHVKLSEECWALDKCYLIFIIISIFTLLKNYVYDTTSVRKQIGADGTVLLGKCRCLPPPPDTQGILQSQRELIGKKGKELAMMLEKEKSQPKELKQGVVWVCTGCC